MDEIYLGDGLYARFDRFGMLILRAPREGGDHWVGLEPEVLESLLTYVASFAANQRERGAEPFTANTGTEHE